MTINATTPPTVAIDFFDYRALCSLYVPSGSKSAYEAADYWKEFKEIIEMPDSRSAQTLELASIPAMTYGDAAYSLPQNTTEGLTLTWSVDNSSVASINGNTLTVIGAGTATVTATQAGNDNYQAFSREFTLTVNKAMLTISANDCTKQEGDANPELTISYSGFVNGDNANALTTQPSITTTATVDSPAGTYPITVSGAASNNYEFTYVNGTLSVTEKATSLVVTDISQLDNVIYIDPMEVRTGTQATISLKMKNTAAIRGFQFDLYLPDGVTVVKSSKGKIQGFLSAGRLPDEDEHTLTFSEHENGSVIRFLCNSQYDETFTGNDGEIATLLVNIADGMAEGDYPLQLKNMKLTETNISNYYETALVQSKLSVFTYVTGDISGDGVVDISDYTGIANHIHGNTPDGFNARAADVDGNNAIDVSDYTGIANIIHTGSIYGNNSSNAPAMMLSPMRANTDLSTYDNVIYISPFTASSGTQTSISIKMKNTAAIRGFQFDLCLPDGMTVAKSSLGRIQGFLSAGRLPNEDEHTLTFSEHENGSVIRFLCNSEYDETFTGNDGEIATLLVNIDANMADGDYPLQMKNMKLTETDISKFYTADLIETTVTIGATDNRTILDETFTTAPASATNVDVRVRRKIKADEWSTICLPFAMDEMQVKAAFGDDVQLAEFKKWEATDWDADDNTTAIDVTFANATAITANKPYIIKVSQAIDEFTADGVDIAPEDEPTVTVGKVNRGTFGSFTGSYVPITIDEECLFLSENKFWYSTGKTKMKGYRAYFYFQDVLVSYSSSSNAKIGYTINDDVDNINLTHMLVDNDSWYTLEGMKLGTKPTKPGVYLHGGKKVVIK